MNFRTLTLMLQIALFISALQLAITSTATAQGYTEINQAVIENSGGFPYQIDQPGSYRFTGNVIKDAGAGNVAAIVINSGGVDLDLRGFFLAGPGTCARNASNGVVTCTGHVPGSGIQQTGALSDITIRNGTVKGFFNGISTSGTNVRIEMLTVSQNAFLGLSAIGDGSSVHQVSAQRNGTSGIVVQNNAAVSNCNASQNDDYGISANLHSSVTRSFAMGNRLGGMQLNPVAVFSLNNVLDNFGPDPVFLGQDAGDNNCTNAAGAAVGC